VIRRLLIPSQLGEDVEVRVLLWYKSEGDSIADGDALVELETDKAIILVTAKQAGTLRRCFAPAGEWLKVGQVAAWVSDEVGEPLPAERGVPVEDLLANFETT
jgi:pyruvate/2-oxoglutarate dehydrogenase complex dihydrolipoamide acyltransferase (E2) component